MTEQSIEASTSDSLSYFFKKVGYCLTLLPVIFLPLSYWAGHYFGSPNLWAYFPLFFVYVVIPILDHLVGTDSVNPDEESEVPAMSKEWFYPFLTLLSVPVQFTCLFYSMTIFVSGELSFMGQIGWLLSMGTIGGIIAINVGHELIHKDTKLEQWAGGLLLASVNYAGFKVEHLRGHHVHVSTPEDASSSRYKQSLYQFLPHAFKHNFLNAWKLEAKRLAGKNLPALHWRNELIWWYTLSFSLLVLFSVLWGWVGAFYYIAQGLLAAGLLEVINYVEHYGLHRRKLENGRYERTSIEHSWNSNYLITNLFLFQLQRHSDHHAFPKRRYQVLRHHDESPQLPSGYATMVVLAFIPPLWFKVMNPRVEAYYKDDTDQLVTD